MQKVIIICFHSIAIDWRINKSSVQLLPMSWWSGEKWSCNQSNKGWRQQSKQKRDTQLEITQQKQCSHSSASKVSILQSLSTKTSTKTIYCLKYSFGTLIQISFLIINNECECVKTSTWTPRGGLKTIGNRIRLPPRDNFQLGYNIGGLKLSAPP